MSGFCSCVKDPVFGLLKQCDQCIERHARYQRINAARPTVRCGTCDQPVWGNEPYHRSCCPQPSDKRDWNDLTATRCINGQILHFVGCDLCHGRHGIRKAAIPTWIGQPAALTADYTRTNQPCARCHSTLTEYHHWAPQAIFQDADDWPGSWLCKACHTLWHTAMRDSGAYRLDQRRYCDWAPTDPTVTAWRRPGIADSA